MEYKLIDWSPKFAGTCLQGYVDASYEQLQRLFGPPLEEPADGYKTSTDWRIEFEDGVVASIYDYKDTSTYSSELPSVAEFRAQPSFSWHIGGFVDDEVVARVQAIVDSNQEPGL